MSFGRKYDTRLPQLTERIHDFLRTKHLTGLVEHEFQNVNEPTGWATQSEIDTLNKVQIAIRLLGAEITKFE